MTQGVFAEVQELIGLRRYCVAAPIAFKCQSNQAGNNITNLRGRGMDFAEVRNYQAGDEIRHMEWRITARTGKPHIKLYQQERERPLIILGDFNSSMLFGTRVAFKSVIAARLAALFAWTAIKQGDKVGGLLFSKDTHYEFVPKSREIGALPFLGAVSKLTKQNLPDYSTNTSMQEALLRLHRVTKPGSLIVIISDFYSYNQECEQHLIRLRSHNDVLIYHVCDPLELEPPKPAAYAMSNGKKELILDTSINAIRESYATYCQQRINQLKNHCNRLKIQYTLVTSEMDLPFLVRQTFPRRKRV